MRKSRLEIRFPLSSQIVYWFGETYSPKSNEFLLNHSRSALMLALKALDLPKRSRVGVMVYNCHTVMNSVWQCGLTPVFIDVTKQLKIDVEQLDLVADSLEALIVTHLFGILNDVDAIRQRYPKLVIIEDCAHAFGLSRVSGDFATFSVGQGKLPSIGDGGILYVKNERYLQSIVSQLAGLKPSRSFKLYLKLLTRAVLYSPVVYNLLTKHLIACRRNSIANPQINESISLMDKGVSAIYKKEVLNIPRIIHERLNNAASFDKKYQLFFGFNAFMACGIYDSPNVKAKDFRQIDTATHFKHCIKWAEYYGYIKGTCPTAEYLTQHLLVVPTY